MAQSGWRLPPELLKAVRIRAAEEGVRQNAWVERALESALSEAQGPAMREQAGSGPVPSSKGVRPAASSRTPAAVPGVKTAREIASSKSYACPKPNCIYVSDSPGVCVHHRTERLK